MSVRILVGDCRTRLAELDAGSVQTCVTSPPYFGLRDYGTASWEGGDAGCSHRVGGQVQDTKAPGAIVTGVRPGVDASRCRDCGARRVDSQIGLESTPDAFVAEMVAVFREVRRVLRDDGTLWLNLGDSYAATVLSNNNTPNANRDGSSDASSRAIASGLNGRRVEPGLPPKNLLGIPWRVARALQEPYYTGTIKRVEDRVWLAAMLDAEGCLFIHRRKAGSSNGQGYERKNDSFSPGIEIANTSLAIIERISVIVGKGSVCSQSPEQNGRRRQTLYRWNLRTTECRDLVRELYPHLVAKQQQARILCGCPSSGERAAAAHAALISLHRTGMSDVDFPAPATMFEPGWYLRSDIIWSKSNPMPESVTDRPTKSHEYLFLLTKSERYTYDADAIAEPAIYAGKEVHTNGNDGMAHNADGNRTRDGFRRGVIVGETRNKRTVWTVATQPFKGAHFATFPPALIEPCILAGSKAGDTVLDPFGGAGTTGLVADRLGRNAVLCELNPTYAAMAERRLQDDGGMLMQVRVEP